MAKRCTEGGTVHGSPVADGSPDTIIVGPEEVTYQRMKCADCNQGLANQIVSRRRITNGQR